MATLKEILSFAGGATGIFFIAALFIKELWKRWLDRDIEAYKSRLSADHARALEQLRANLQIAAAERAVRFAKLHERMAETLADTYTRVVVLQQSVGAYVKSLDSEGRPPPGRWEAVNKATRELSECVLSRRIFMPAGTASRVCALLTDLRGVVQKYEEELEPGFVASPGSQKMITEQVTSRFPPIIAELESEFRLLLGWEEAHS